VLPGLLPAAPSRAADTASLKKASNVVPRLATGCGQDHSRVKIGLVPTPVLQTVLERVSSGLPVAGLIDGRHLGCGGSRSSSRKCGRCGPWPREMPCKAGPRASVTRAARRVRGPRAPTLRGGGARVVRSSKAQLPDRSDAWCRRSLLPTTPRSHDERCPSGSGWGRGLSQSPARVTACGHLWKDAGARMAECGKPHAHHCAREAVGSKACQPLARETSAGDRQRNRMGLDSRRLLVW